MPNSNLIANEENNRVLNFKRLHNFRDLGGYPTADGHRVRWGVLYRSGHLAKMSRRDRKKFASLNIDTVIDLRSEYERIRKPNRLPEQNQPELLELSIMDEANALMRKEIRTRIDARKYDELDSAALMQDAYRQFAVEFLAEFRHLMHTVLEAAGKPVLWHCTAGKDRTGFAAAVLLRLLGVNHDIVMQDYMLSNQHVHLRKGQMLLLRLLKGKGAVNLVKPLLTVQPGWLEASFQAIREHWGSFEDYTRDGLALSTQDIHRMKNTLLV